MSTTVTFRGTQDDLLRVLQAVPDVCAGSTSYPFDAVAPLYRRIGVALLDQIRQDYITKACGNTGRDGVRWKPLSPATIARRLMRSAQKSSGNRKGVFHSKKSARWKQVYAGVLASYRARGMNENDARSKASDVAWKIVQREFPRTPRVAIQGNVLIGIDTYRMLDSLFPGSGETPSGQPEQVFKVSKGSVSVGSRTPYFPKFHAVRPVWPLSGDAPPVWMSEVMIAAEEGVVRLMVVLLRSGWVP